MSDDASKIIDALGGTVQTAKLCEVFPQAVSQWRRRGIPSQQLRFLRLVRPEVFGLTARRKRPRPG